MFVAIVTYTATEGPRWGPLSQNPHAVGSGAALARTRARVIRRRFGSLARSREREGLRQREGEGSCNASPIT
jgi:hypothetical protein